MESAKEGAAHANRVAPGSFQRVLISARARRHYGDWGGTTRKEPAGPSGHSRAWGGSLYLPVTHSTVVVVTK